MTESIVRDEGGWWTRLRQPQVWGRPISELALVFEHPRALGLLRPESGIERLVVRPAWGPDHNKLEAVRRDNRQWLGKWEATLPPGSDEALSSLYTYRRRLENQMQLGEALTMVIEPDNRIAGLVSIGGVQRGAMSLANLGYWIGEEWAGVGVTSLAVASVIDLVIGELGLHRLEINIRPENGPSLALAHGLGLRREGLRVRYMCIAGQWRDHEGFAVDQEMLRSGGLVETRLMGRYS